MTIDIVTEQKAKAEANKLFSITEISNTKDETELAQLAFKAVSEGKIVGIPLSVEHTMLVRPGVESAEQIKGYIDHYYHDIEFKYLNSHAGKIECLLNEPAMEAAHKIRLYTKLTPLETASRAGPEAVIQWLKDYIDSDLYKDNAVNAKTNSRYGEKAIKLDSIVNVAVQHFPRDVDGYFEIDQNNPALKLIKDIHAYTQTPLKGFELENNGRGYDYVLSPQLEDRIRSFEVSKPGAEVSGPVGKQLGEGLGREAAKSLT